MKGWLRGLRNPKAGSIATRSDISACFRLLLGRKPNPEELHGHMAQAGQPLDVVVAGYLNSLEFARRGLAQSQPGQIELARHEGFDIYVDAGDIAVGRHVASGSYEPEVTAVFRRLLRPGMGVLDIGANMGFFTMLAAHIVGPDGFVLAVEPNPDNARLIEASRQVNHFGQVKIAQVAAGRELGLLSLNATHSNGTTSPFASGIGGALTARSVASVPLDCLIRPSQRIDVVKIDVEGAELNALAGAESMIDSARPVLITEFSPGLLPGISGVDGPAYLRWLYRKGYRVGVIGVDGEVEPMGTEPERVMTAYRQRGVDHIDLLAEPFG